MNYMVTIPVPKKNLAQISPFAPALTLTAPSVPGHNADMLTDATSVDVWDICRQCPTNTSTGTTTTQNSDTSQCQPTRSQPVRPSRKTTGSSGHIGL